MKHAIEANGIVIVRTPTGLGVAVPGIPVDFSYVLEVQIGYHGRPVKKLHLNVLTDFPWRDFLGNQYDHLAITICVKDGEQVLAELGVEDDIQSFMIRQGEQHHITENYVSVPPALTITDSLGAVWTLGMIAAPKERAPEGEFAFPILRDGVEAGEIGSRIEIRNGTVRTFTRHGWKKWNGRSFF